MPYPPTVADFQGYFTIEFVYGDGKNTVQDAQIQRALNESQITFNPGLWDGVTVLGAATDGPTEQEVAFLYLAAHFLARNIQAAGGLAAVKTGRGINQAGGGTLQSVSAGNVSEAFAIPEFVREDPNLSPYMQTPFGQKYLTLLTPRLTGNMGIAPGNPWGTC
jgi:hypothetical protein